MLTIEELMTPEPVVVREQTSIAECAHLLYRQRFRHLPVVDLSGQLTGVVTDFGVFQHGGLAGAHGELWVPYDEEEVDLTADDVAEPAAVVASRDEGVTRVLRLLAGDPTDVAVVVNERRHPVGIVTEHDGVRLAQEIDAPLDAEQTGSWPVLTVQADDPASRAWDRVLAGQVRHVLVMDGDSLYGVISTRDLIGDDVPRGRQIDCRSVVRNTDVITVPTGTPLKVVAQRMAEHKVGCIPVMGPDGKPEAVVTRTDVIQALVSDLEEERLFQQ